MVQRLVPMDARRATASTPLARQHIHDFPHPTVEERHRTHHTRFVRREEREGRQEVIGPVPRRDLVRERRKRPQFGDGGDAVEGGMTQGMRRRESSIMSRGPDERGRWDRRVFSREDGVGWR